MFEVVKEFLKPKLTRGSVLRWSPYAWSKLLFFRDISNNEIGGYALAGTEDPLLITDIFLIKQEVTSVTIEFDTKDSIDFVENMTDKGVSPWQYGTFWHTHPGNSASPSITDENNFNKNFSIGDMNIFFIIAKGGDQYCRVRHNTGAGIEVTIGTEIDYKVDFPASDKIAWEAEYKEKVTESKSPFVMMGDGGSGLDWINKWRKDPERLYGKSQQTVGEILESIQEKEEMDENLQMWWDQSEDCVWFYNEEEEDYWKYSPGEQAFFDHDDSRISVKNIPKECKIGDIIRFGNESFKQEYGAGVVANNNEEISDSFLSEIEEVEPCPYG